MKFGTMLLIGGVIALLFGLAFVLAPAPMLAMYAVTTDASGLWMSRLFGAALVGIAAVQLLMRNLQDARAQRSLCTALLVSNAVGFLVALFLQFSGLANMLIWSTVAIYGLLALGYGYLAFTEAS